MALFALRRGFALLDPTRCDGTALPVELLLMAKVMVLAWIVTGHIAILPAPFLPFIPAFERLPPEVFRTSLLLIASLASAALFCNCWVRSCCFLIGASVLVGTLASRPFFSNNRVFFACFMVLIGLYAPGGARWIRAQLVVVYFGAGIDKLLDVDWRSGRFFEHFARRLFAEGNMWSPGYGASPKNPLVELYMTAAAALPQGTFAQAISAAIIAVELSLAVFLLLRPHRAVVLTHVVFHSAILLFTGSPFGMFFYASVASTLAFVKLPAVADAAPARHAEKNAFACRGRLLGRPSTWLGLTLLLAGPWFRIWLVPPVLLFVLWSLPREPR